MTQNIHKIAFSDVLRIFVDYIDKFVICIKAETEWPPFSDIIFKFILLNESCIVLQIPSWGSNK